MATEQAGRSAYADLVGGLLDARTDPATERFDAELAVFVTNGTVTPEAARTLRFWQRASLRNLVDHARVVLPPALAALEAARAHSSETVFAEQEWWSESRPAGDVAGKPDARDDTAINLRERRSRLIVAGLMESEASSSDDD
jgi:hypothetical protein